MGAHATLGSRAWMQRGSDKEASMVVSWTVVSWMRQAVVAFALVAFALIGIEVTLILLAAAFLY